MTKKKILKTTSKNWTMFTGMPQPFTSIYNNLSQSDKKTCLNIAVKLKVNLLDS